ncbi:class I SAM-dependent methyltransferase [Sneathiella limimaris]|uniref:class I SAM-dependent methyltransferase n=1 Tax=Sneathiella limimaris TaxID=1964213 RepID=UPI001469F2C2|nr:class I SAM-dependent methyltransferase [Sneathiella limimaris]
MKQDYWNDRYASKDLIWSAGPNQFFKTEVDNLKPGKAIDLASGEGRNALYLAELGWNIKAVDFSEVALEKAEKIASGRHLKDKIEFINADLNTYLLPKSSFDLVAIIYLQLPQDQMIPIIHKAVHAVAPGGTFLMIGHHSQNLTHGYGGPQNPENLYTEMEIVGTINGELAIEKAEQVNRIVDTDEGPQTAIDCLVRAIKPNQ